MPGAHEASARRVLLWMRPHAQRLRHLKSDEPRERGLAGPETAKLRSRRDPGSAVLELDVVLLQKRHQLVDAEVREHLTVPVQCRRLGLS